MHSSNANGDRQGDSSEKTSTERFSASTPITTPTTPSPTPIPPPTAAPSASIKDEDLAAAHLALREANDKRIPDAQRKTLHDDWQELIIEIRDTIKDGKPGHDAIGPHIDILAGRNKTRADQVRAAIEAARDERQSANPAVPDRSEDDDYHRTDLGNSERLIDSYGHEIKYVPDWKRILCWDGQRWVIGDEGLKELAKRIPRDMLMEASSIKDNDERKAMVAWAFSCESAHRINAMIGLAKSHPRITATPDSFDSHPYLLNCLNGTVDLRTGKLRPHDRADLLSQVCPVHFNADAQCPNWLATLRLVFDGNENLISFFQRLIGYSITGYTSEQIIAIWKGSGENGKSTIIEALMGTLGYDYSLKATSNFMMRRRFDAHPTEKADLYRRRIVVATETAKGASLDEQMAKELSGSDRITARRMREDFWSFDPTHKLFLITNHAPRIKGIDHAIWRRILLIPFDVQIKKKGKLDLKMPEKLAGERAGILAWCVHGCLEWRANGLNPPECVKVATKTYREDQNELQAFIDAKCVVGDDFSISTSLLFDMYRQWALAERLRPLTQMDFTESIVELGYKKTKNSCMVFKGLKWQPAVAEANPPSPETSLPTVETTDGWQ